MIAVDIRADLNSEDQTGYVWTLLDDSRDPSLIRPGRLVVAGDYDAPVVAVVIDLIPHTNATVVHLDVVGTVDTSWRSPADSPRLHSRSRVA